MVLFERLDEEGNGNEIDTLTSCNEVFLVFLRYKELRGILYVKYLWHTMHITIKLQSINLYN